MRLRAEKACPWLHSAFVAVLPGPIASTEYALVKTCTNRDLEPPAAWRTCTRPTLTGERCPRSSDCPHSHRPDRAGGRRGTIIYKTGIKASVAACESRTKQESLF